MKNFAAEFSHTYNAEVRRQYSNTAKRLGNRSLLDIVAPRLALRQHTPYPYKFVEADSLLPSDETAFGRIIRRSRQEGITEIHQSLGARRKEHKWLFLPQDEVWVDTTIRAQTDQVEAEIYPYIFLSHMQPEIEDFHTHLDLAATELANEHGEEYLDHYFARQAVPSSNDLLARWSTALRVAPDSQFISSVISHNGVTSAALTAGLSQGFKIHNYESLPHPPSPAETIQTLLNDMTRNVLYTDGQPAFSLKFEPLV